MKQKPFIKVRSLVDIISPIITATKYFSELLLDDLAYRAADEIHSAFDVPSTYEHYFQRKPPANTPCHYQLKLLNPCSASEAITH